ncbi:MAG: gluconate 2-dehydrogenase subunit 3 family protein [Acidobacteriaceae bacterium]|nr:gluconate 2-dehydrogenase subunit 3 family protein [Acidobacteriaceae bacterium]
MQDSTDFEKPTRRNIFRQLVAGAGGAGVLPVFGQNAPPQTHQTPEPVTKEEATPHRYVYFTPKQLETLNALVERIIPADEHSPGAKEAGVPEYIDIVIADASAATKRLWAQGLLEVDRMAVAESGNPYARCSPENQVAILRKIASDEEAPKSLGEQFFRALKRATIDGYYTSKMGIHDDLQYQGNDALAEFPGCPHGAPK